MTTRPVRIRYHYNYISYCENREDISIAPVGYAEDIITFVFIAPISVKIEIGISYDFVYR